VSLLPDFEKQFDKTALIRSGGSGGSGVAAPAADAPTFDVAPDPVPESEELPAGEDFEIGI